MVSFNFPAMIWMFVSPPNSYVEILIPNGMVLAGGAFGRWLGHGGGALMNGIKVPVKEAPESSLAPSTRWEHSWSQQSATWKRPSPTWSSWHPDLGLPGSSEKSVSVVYKPPSLWYFVTAAQMDWDIP